jgi:SAM-dependent methyltransferase
MLRFGMSSTMNSPWSAPSVVAGFARSSPNEILMRFAAAELERLGRPPRSRPARALDLGCGAGRNAVPLANLGWELVGLDNSLPMLAAAAARSGELAAGNRLHLAASGMDGIPLADASCDFVVAHGIWNLARSAAEFRRAVREAARVAVPGAGLFVFTFSRNTFADGVAPVAGEPFVFTQFSGAPQCFLTADQLVDELGEAGFAPDPAVPLTEYNRPAPGSRPVAGGPAPPTRPVIYEAAFRRRG